MRLRRVGLLVGRPATAVRVNHHAPDVHANREAGAAAFLLRIAVSHLPITLLRSVLMVLGGRTPLKITCVVKATAITSLSHKS